MIETILITGANRGIGLALTKLSLTKKLRVEACCRDLKNSIELKKLSDEYTDLNIVEMDVKSSNSILKASKKFKNPIDILVCNAGINNGKGNIFSKEHNEKTILDVMMVNVAGPFLTIQHLYDNLNKKTIFIELNFYVSNYTKCTYTLCHSKLSELSKYKVSKA